MEPRTAIVTGASHGIGAHIARALAARAMNLLLVARSEDELRRLAAELRTPEVTVAVAAVDLAGRQAAQQVAEAARAELGRVDVLVNNAATEPQTRFHVLTTAEIEDVLQVDLISPLLLSRLLLPGMLERGYGRIINVSSLAGHTSFPYTEAYAAAKDGLTAFSRVLTSDYRDTGVSATSLILGPVKDAGVTTRTLAETGLTASTAFSVTPEKVAAAVLRAISKPRAEMVVSVGPGRFLKALMDYFPGLGPAINRLSGATKLMASVAEYREAQRGQSPDRAMDMPTDPIAELNIRG
jgi:short-subunit dehydrogenase